jgi:glycosyltransferase involved in cell wall biosynthesis
MDEIQQQPPKVSVLIVSRNSAAPLRRCLASLEQSAGREQLEIVVVDNGSLDESPNLDTEFPKVQMLRLPRNFGAVKALNIGMRTATGNFLFLLPPEFEVQPDTVIGLASRLESSPEAAAVCPLPTDPEGRPVFRHRRIPSPGELYSAWRDGEFQDWQEPDLSSETVAVDYPRHPVMMVRRAFLQGMRYIDERYSHFWWDLEICCQIKRSGKKLLLLPGVRIEARGPEPAEIGDPGARAVLAADSALGACTFTRKHYGWAAGFKLRLQAVLSAFGSTLLALVRFRDAGYHLSRLSCLLSGQKIDGSQRAL